MDTQLAERISEIAALTTALQETERSLREVTGELTATSDRVSRTEVELSAAAEHAKGLKQEMDTQLAERFGEIARLTRLVSDAEGAARKAEAQRDWIREAASFLLNGSRSVKGRISGLLPASWRRSRQMEQLKERGIFDAGAYLSANPDVAKSTQDALRHFLRHGLTEGRVLSLNTKGGAEV
jgi:chromosome segregation ATPase